MQLTGSPKRRPLLSPWSTWSGIELDRVSFEEICRLQAGIRAMKVDQGKGGGRVYLQFMLLRLSLASPVLLRYL